jgi:hemerythrin superfamily protein
MKNVAIQIFKSLTPHNNIEEEVFYPAFKIKGEENLIKEAYVEQDGAQMLIAEIEAGGPDGEFL